MTDRTDHRAAAERWLADADEWAAQVGEPTLGELSSLAYAAVHALLAIHDTLTAADRYATNEAKQREAGDADSAPSVTASAADDPGGDAVDGEEDERRNLNAQTRLERLLCPECGHDLEDHGIAPCCECPRSPLGVVYALIERAVDEALEQGRRPSWLS